jgi:sec-independent protein translocase protein TatA
MLTDLLQPTHLIIVLAVALLVLGPKRLPGAGRAVGQGLREFKESLTASHDHDHDSLPGMIPSENEIPAP